MGGLTSLLLLLCVGVTLSAVLDLQKRIDGSRDCDPPERRYHVKILDANNNFVCGGSLLRNNWILTAAHCNAGSMRVVLGAHPYPFPEKPSVAITAAPVKYADDHDIMLLKLPNPTAFQHVDLPDCGPGQSPPIGATVRMAGNGPNTADTRLAEFLQCADILVSQCVSKINPYPEGFRFCGKTTGVKLRLGDSGGGVEYRGKIYGVIQSDEGGNVPAPETHFMNVCSYKAWIEETIKK